MADAQQVNEQTVPSPETVSDVDSVSPPEPKRQKIQWQETLLSLIAGQQEQLALLTQRFNMAEQPTPCSSASSSGYSPAHVPSSSPYAATSFRLADFNPDTAAHAIEEWFDVATKLKSELHICDALMIAKAGEALKGRAHRYYCEWRPVARTWDEFIKDLSIAFPDRETPGARAYTAATLKSRDCDTLSDYAIQKLRCIKRFHDKLPWATIVSMVEYGLDSSEAQASIRIQAPTCERELLKMLSEFDARRPKRSSQDSRSVDRINTSKLKSVERRSSFKGACYKCGRTGHRQEDCRVPSKNRIDAQTSQTTEKRNDDNVPTCTHCKRIGHLEKNCWYKHGKPKKVNLI